MAILQITEFANLAHDVDGNVMQAPAEPAITTQAVTYTTSAQSAALNRKTTLVRMIATADCHVKFGTNPTATATDERLEANVEYIRGIQRGFSAMKIAGYDGSS